MSASISELEQRATLHREKLASTMGQLRSQMQPTHLVKEASETISTKASGVFHVAAEKAKSPRGIGGVAIAAIGLGVAAFLTIRSRAKRPPALRQRENIDSHILDRDADEKPVSPFSQPALAEPAPAIEKPLVNKELIGTAIGLAAALTVGAALSRLVPASETEEQLLGGVGDELKDKAMLWARQYVSNLAQPSNTGSFSPVNVIAVALALLMAEKSKPDV
jgi:hypothetical protein